MLNEEPTTVASGRLHALYRRHGRNMGQFLKFAAVGGSGVLVNMAILIGLQHLLPAASPGAREADVFFPLFGGYNIRWYHVMSSASFLLANLWNYQLNRWWSFKSARPVNWWPAYRRFLAIGVAALAVGQVLFTALMNTTSPIHLPRSVFDGTSGLRTPMYWANLIMIVVTTPLSYLGNKLWTFRSSAGRGPSASPTAGLSD